MPGMTKPNSGWRGALDADKVESTLANRRSLNANQRTARPLQDLSTVKNGFLTGRGGGQQTLGSAAQARLAAGVKDAAASPAAQAPGASVPAWKQLADAGIAGQGSRAANMAKLTGMSSPNVTSSAASPGQSTDEVAAYWTPERMASAAPMASPRQPMLQTPEMRAAAEAGGGRLPGTGAAPLPMTLDPASLVRPDLAGGGGMAKPMPGAPPGATGGGATSGFSPNLPPEIMQRLSALRGGPVQPGGPGGGMASQVAPLVTGAAGYAPGGAPSLGLGPGGGGGGWAGAAPGVYGPSGAVGGSAAPGAGAPNFADYWSQQGTPWGPIGPSGAGLPGGGAAGMGPIGSYAK